MADNNDSSCCCEGEKITLIFPCSGASDVGELSDRAARQLTRNGYGKMYCLAGIGGGVSGIIESTRSADRILAIDGCPLQCAKKTLERAGFTGFTHMELTGHGFIKGKTPTTDLAVGEVVTIIDRHNK